MYLRLLLISLFLLTSHTKAWAQTKAVDEVTLEVNAVQIILNDEHRDGVDWGAIVSDFHTEPLKKDGDGAVGKKYRLSFGTVTQDDYAVLLDALGTVGSMKQYTQLPIKIIPGAATHLSALVPIITVNVLLKPLKSGDISLHIEPHVTLPSGDIRDGHKTTTPISLVTQTDMTVANNTTIVIGGLIREEEITKTHKLPLLGSLPLLGDLPLVGLVFRYQGHLVQKTETIFFMTVRSPQATTPEDTNSS